MRRIRLPHLTFLGRIILFLTAFCAALLLQMGIGHYQSKYVMDPLEKRTQSIQAVSQFLNDVEGMMSVMESYRWDYGDKAALVDELRSCQTLSAVHLEQIRADITEVSEEHYLLASAAHTTYDTWIQTQNDMIDALLDDRSDDASRLYYDKAEPCGSYLRQYTQQLLERAIVDNQDAYNELTALNERLKQVQNGVIVLCLILGCALVVSLFRLVRSVMQMSRASRAISQGRFDTPDVDETQRDEIGDMAKAFNEMKRSMKRQVELLNEKNEMERELHVKETEALELQNLMEREKLQQLRSQINPHFLFNTLNVIIYTAQQEGAGRTQTLIASLSRLFRYALGSNDVHVPLSREVHILDEFYSLYRARFGDRVRMAWHISPEVDLTETMVPSFILQPLVENSFKHGVCPKEEGGCVDISIRAQGSELEIIVADDGVGMTPEVLDSLRENLRDPPTTGEHIGLYNVAARLRLCSKGHSMQIQSESGKGTTVALRLPLVVPGTDEVDRDD